MKELENAAHFILDEGFGKRMIDLSIDCPPGDYEGRMPAPKVFIEGLTPTGALYLIDMGDSIEVNALHPNGEGPWLTTFGAYRKKSNQLALTEEAAAGMSDEEIDKSDIFLGLVALANLADLFFSLISEPRFVVQRPVSNLKRRMAAKSIGKPALRHTWVKVGWTIGGSTTPRNTVAGSAPARAFHMRRAHWRNYGDRHTKNAERRPHRAGWWVWVEAHYAGNPALGEIKHHYCPRLEDPGKSSRVVHTNIAARIAGRVAR